MSSENPFAENHSRPGYPGANPGHPNAGLPRKPASPKGGGRPMLVLAIFLGTALFFCGGFATLGYFAVRTITGGGIETPLPEHRNTPAEDMAQFNKSLASLASDPCTDIEVCEFVESSLELLREGEAMPFSPEMFVEAMVNSPQSRGKIGIVERLAVRSWISEYPPTPDDGEDYERILDVRLDDTGKLATVDLLLYSEDSQAASQQWFLVKEAGQWKIYDWQRLEYGRRMSDEYAGYVIDDSSRAEGYDTAMQQLTEAEVSYYDDEDEAARQMVRNTENIQMLPADAPIGKLRIAYTWMRLNDYEQPIRVLKNIRQPDKMWGVWPTLGICYVSVGDNEKALEAAQRAQEQSPNHPNVHWLFSVVYSAMDRTDEAADAVATALRICPEDTSYLDDVVANARAEDIPLLLDVASRQDGEYEWSSIINEAAASTEWAQALVDAISDRDDLPEGVLEMAQGNLEWSRENYDEAAAFFLKANSVANLAFLKELSASDHRSSRLAEDRYDELLRESPDLDDTVRTLAKWALNEDLDCEPEVILSALDAQASLSDDPWAAIVRGWAHGKNGQQEQALEDYSHFLDWLAENKDSLDESDEWVPDSVGYEVAASMIELGRSAQVLERWPANVDRHDQIGSELLTAPTEQIEQFVLATEDDSTDSVQLQRQRLLAQLALREGNASECDRHHLQAIQLGVAVYTDEDDVYSLNALVSRRARDLVWNKYSNQISGSTDSETSDRTLRDLLIRSAVYAAVMLRDANETEFWLSRADEEGIHAGDDYSTIQQSYGELLLDGGDLDSATDAFEKSYENVESSSSWRARMRRSALVDALLRTKRHERLKNLLLEEVLDESESSSVSAEALIALADGDGEKLQKELTEIEADEVTEWLSESDHAKWLQLYADESWTRELLSRHPVSISSQRAQESGELLLKSGNMVISRAAIADSLSNATGETLEVQLVPSHPEPNGRTHEVFLAKSASGQRLLIDVSTKEYVTDSLPESLARPLGEPVVRLGIDVIDDGPHATKRLFDIAANLADTQGASPIAFVWRSNANVWHGDDLKDQLAWEDRVPVSPRVRILTLTEKPVEGETEVAPVVGYSSYAEWEQKSQEADEPLEVIVRQSTGMSNEAIPSELISVDADEYEILVRPKADAKIDRTIKAGITYRCHPSQLVR